MLRLGLTHLEGKKVLLEKERNRIINFGKKLVASNLTTGTGGNLSIANRKENLAAISPSGIDYFQIQPENVAVVDMAGEIQDGNSKPSSELSFHLELYNNRTDVQAVVHLIRSMLPPLPACTGNCRRCITWWGFQETRCPLRLTPLTARKSSPVMSSRVSGLTMRFFWPTMVWSRLVRIWMRPLPPPKK